MSEDDNRFSAEQELNERILASLQSSFSGEETKRWMTAIKDDRIEQAEEVVAAGSKENQLSTSMANVIDKLFDNFKRYSFDFNRQQENKQWEVSCERPSSMRTTADYMEHGKPIKFCIGHLSTKEYALVIQGEEVRIRAYFLPIEFLMGFRPGQSDFPPYLDMRLGVSGNSVTEPVWLIEGQTVGLNSLAALSRRLLTQLIKVTKGEANYDEQFVFNPQEAAAAEVAPKVELDRSYDDDVSPLVKEAPAARAVEPAREPISRSYAVASTSQNEFFQDAAPSPVSQSRQKWQEAAQMAVANAQVRPASYAVESSLPTSQTSANTELPGQIQVPLAVSAPVQEPAPVREQAPVQEQAQFDAVLAAAAAPKAADTSIPAQISAPAKSELEPARESQSKAEERPPKEFFAAQEELNKTTRSTFSTAEVNRNIAKSIKALFDTVDASIHELTQAGVEAMHDDDIEKVGEVMKQSKTLKKLRESIVQLSKDWQKSI
ncbi:MAG: hypothetical protein K2Y32_13540 [Candidatus Obscuribacterales bacterium]|nr:hypothetical protein [Candidatus Obscuribacterales bacterium]